MNIYTLINRKNTYSNISIDTDINYYYISQFIFINKNKDKTSHISF